MMIGHPITTPENWSWLFQTDTPCVLWNTCSKETMVSCRNQNAKAHTIPVEQNGKSSLDFDFQYPVFSDQKYGKNARNLGENVFWLSPKFELHLVKFQQGTTFTSLQEGVDKWQHSMLTITLRWRHNGCDGVSNHQPHACLLSRLFRRRSKKTSKLRVAGLCVGNSPGTVEFPAQRVSNAENVSIWWRRHESQSTIFMKTPQDLPKWGCIMPTSIW